MSTQIPGLYIYHDENKGRCVYTAFNIKKDDVIEIAPVIVLPPDDLPIIHKTSLHDYYFLWGKDQKECAIALGYGSLYNHAIHPNANYIINLADQNIKIFAIKDIQAGEEITINYEGEPGNSSLQWFEKRS